MSQYIRTAGEGKYKPIDQKDKKFSLEVTESEENKVEYIFKAKP